MLLNFNLRLVLVLFGINFFSATPNPLVVCSHTMAIREKQIKIFENIYQKMKLIMEAPWKIK